MSFSKEYESFELDNELTIIEGEGGLPFINVENDFASGLISIYGAQLLSYKLKTTTASEESDLLFLSGKAYYEEGKSIKGGIPICWPWFGQDPEKRGRPAHGFARNMIWSLLETSSNKGAGTQIVLALSDSEATKKLWPHAFKLILTIDIGKTLKLSLTTGNTGEQAFSITQALHTYFAVSDINKTRIAGLEQAQYIDTIQAGWPLLIQQGEIIFQQEVDRIYTQSSALTLFDDGNNNSKNRQVNIQSKGSKTTVVWNPWAEISANSADLSDEAYQQFVCIETANAAEDVIEIVPNESFTIEVEYS